VRNYTDRTTWISCGSRPAEAQRSLVDREALRRVVPA
jgi:hypothetical protein